MHFGDVTSNSKLNSALIASSIMSKKIAAVQRMQLFWYVNNWSSALWKTAWKDAKRLAEANGTIGK